MTKTVTKIENGVKITIAPAAKPRKTERTWSATKYSIFNIGARAARTGTRGTVATPDFVV